MCVEMIVPEEATHHRMWFHREADANINKRETEVGRRVVVVMLYSEGNGNKAES